MGRGGEGNGVEKKMFGLIHSAFLSWRGTLLLAVVCWVVSLMVTAIALSLASIGAPSSIFLLLFGWLLTLGLPNSLAIVLVMNLWQGNSIEVFLVVVASVTLAFQFLCLSMVKQLARSWWGVKP
jgi:hypothetical protein